MAIRTATKIRGDTRETLIAAAAAEFGEQGFAGTDTNRIARRAGFAPQTFYRWFKDKTEVFIAVYRAWEDEEVALMRTLRRQGAGEADVADAAVEHHRQSLMFRRSLRRLSLEDPQVRIARAQSRLRQVEAIRAWRDGALSRETVATALLQLERLSDAVAEGELRDMGLDDTAARVELARILAELRGVAP